MNTSTKPRRTAKKLKNGAPGVWHPIETAPSDQDILVAYDKGRVRLVEAEDNDGDWHAPDADFLEEIKESRGIQVPTHWMQVPTAPQRTGKSE